VSCPNLKCRRTFSVAELFRPPSQEAGLDLRGHVLLEEIGSGGMGKVYRSRDPALGRDLAVKVIHPNLQGNRAAERRFEKEARTLGRLQHPGIVPIYNLGRLPEGRLFFTMKLVEGKTLAEHLRHHPEVGARRAELLPVFAQVCRAVAFAHSRGVIHRDLKPQNIMVGAFGEVQLMDWGLAKLLGEPAGETEEAASQPSIVCTAHTRAPDGGTQAGQGMGTPAYAAPEQARGEPMDERTDVFGLGAILCEILTGQPPYLGAATSEVRRQACAAQLSGAHARLKACGADPELLELCGACLAAKPADRPRDASVVAEQIDAYLAAAQARAEEAQVTARSEAARTLARRTLWLLATLSALGVVLDVAAMNVKKEHADLIAWLSGVGLLLVLGGCLLLGVLNTRRGRARQAEQTSPRAKAAS
jgi:serine/threonine-protein kinase